MALPERRDPDTDERPRRLSSLLERAQNYYEGVLWGMSGATARAYLLDSRGLDEPTLRAFGVGFAPAGGGLLRYLQSDSFSSAELVAAGVAGQADDGRLYDFFRERVVFPIRDAHGRTIAFGGRALDGASPKYLNPGTARCSTSRRRCSRSTWRGSRWPRRARRWSSRATWTR